MAFDPLNLTTHSVHVYNDNEEIIKTFPSSGNARLEQSPQEARGFLTTKDGKSIPVTSPQIFKEVTGLPDIRCPIIVSMLVGQEFKEVTGLPDIRCPIIVSMLVGQELARTGAWSWGVYGPDTGLYAVRGGDGQIKGTKKLIEYCAPKNVLNINS